MEVQETLDPISVGQEGAYILKVTNTGSLAGNQIEVVANVPKQFKIVRATGPISNQINEQTVTYAKLDGLKPGKSLEYRIAVKAISSGDARLKAELRSLTLTDPVKVEESTRILDSGNTLPPPQPKLK